MQKVTDESKLEQITELLDRIDDDHDGQLKVDDVLKVTCHISYIYLVHGQKLNVCLSSLLSMKDY